MYQPWVTADDLSDPTLDEAQDAARAATMILYALSGRKYTGPFRTTERYVQPYVPGRQYIPQLGVAARFRGSGMYGGIEDPVHGPGVVLRHTPVQYVHSIVINDYSLQLQRTVDPDEYDVIDRQYVRPAVGSSWNGCLDLTIDYTHGALVPEAGKRAARVLAEQLLKAQIDPEACELPGRVTSIARQNVSMTLLDPLDFLQDGRTGLYEVDLFLKSVNPDKARKRARVFSPDTPRAQRVTGRTAPTYGFPYTL